MSKSSKRKARMNRNWARMREQILATWGEDIDEKSLKGARGDLNTMVDLIHEQTGDDINTIRRKVMSFV